MERGNGLKIGLVILASCLAYCNVISAPLLYDDTAAVLLNPDVQQVTDISKLWQNDFWGYNMLSRGSHKSYRPVTVLLYRFLHNYFGNWSTAYHVANIVIHALVSVLFYLVCEEVILLSLVCSEGSFIAGMAFALHPIHTEAVCCAVGCAELLSAACFMSSLLVYSKGCGSAMKIKTSNRLNEQRSANKSEVLSSFPNENNFMRHRKLNNNNNKMDEKTKLNKNKQTRKSKQNIFDQYLWLLTTFLSLVIASIGMLCKESGMTVIAVLFVYELLHERTRQETVKFDVSNFLNSHFLTKTVILFMWGFSMLVFRLWIMGWDKPTYSKEENPTAYANEKLTRTLTYLYLCWKNFFLLLYPMNLSYDYSLGTIPLITSWWDVRNFGSLFIVLSCSGCGYLCFVSFMKKAPWSIAMNLGLALLIFPFIPASNLFFPVGFVVAERVLYLPSAGFIVLLILICGKIIERAPRYYRPMQSLVICLLLFYLIRTFLRNRAWTSKENLFRSGLEVYPNTPKILYNWGNILRDQNRPLEAFEIYKKVVKLQPNSSSALNNLGSLYEILEKSMEKAEISYRKASEVNPNSEIGFANIIRLQIAQNRSKNAIKEIKRAIRKVPEGYEIGKVTGLTHSLFEQHRTKEVGLLYFSVLKHSCTFAKSYPAARQKCSMNFAKALQYYAEDFKRKGLLQQYNVLQVHIHNLNSFQPVAIESLLNALSTATTVEEVALILTGNDEYTNSSQLLADQSKLEKAIKLFQAEKYSESKPLFESYIKTNANNHYAIENYASLMFQIGNHKKGEKLWMDLVKKDKECQNSRVRLNLAALHEKNTHHKKAIILLKNCLESRGKFFKSNKDPDRAPLLSVLGNHQWQYSTRLREEGKSIKADEYTKTAIKTLRNALQLDPSNQQAQAILQQITKI